MSKTRELFDAERSQRSSLNYNVTESYNATVRSLGEQVIDPESAITFERKDFGGVFVPAGTYGGFTVESGKHMITCAPGVRFQRDIVIKGTVTLCNAYIEMSSASAGLTIENGGRLILQKCQVIKADGKHSVAADTYIQVNDGGYLSVSDTIFHGTQSNTGHIIYNYNTHASTVAVLGSMNLTDINSPFHHVSYTQVVP